MVRVQSVAPHSVGADLGLGPGYELLSVDGRTLADFLDWEFLSAEEHFMLLARDPEGQLIEFHVERPEGFPMGIELEPPHVRRCANRCDFCFVDGLPQGLRQVLYIRDDDYRLSFRYGNFATLTNLKQRDVDRIIEYRLSPLYVSVHATDPIVRRRLLRNPRAPAILPQLESFGAHGIEFHTQIVLQPGLNDGPTLTQSMEDLFELGNPILSVSVVPVGLTEFSKLHLVRGPTPFECRAALAVVDRFAERALADRGTHWAYGSDDLYLVAGVPLPPPERYDGFDQVENGVGSVRYLEEKVKEARDEITWHSGARIGVVTGTAMGKHMPDLLELLHEVSGAHYELIVVTNDLFGPGVTSAGLLPGRSIARALEPRRDLDIVLLPAEAVNETGVFLDDLPAADLMERLPGDVRFSHDFADALQDGEGA